MALYSENCSEKDLFEEETVRRTILYSMMNRWWGGKKRRSHLNITVRAAPRAGGVTVEGVGFGRGQKTK